jgi:3-hydroxyisobutyrate dehydrogenase-like beta-hydroxyacid dehydrogenase
MRKDVGLAVEAAARAPGEYPVMEQLAALLHAAGDHTFETWRAVGASRA